MNSHSDIPMRKDTAIQYRRIRAILKQAQIRTENIDFSKYWRVGFYIIIILTIGLLCKGCNEPGWSMDGYNLKASWYSVESLKKEGTYKYSKGVMANGHIFNDSLYICATRLFPLGSMVRVTNRISKSFVIVKVTDRIGKRFAKTRIDLSRGAFMRIADLKQGLINVTVERI